MNPFKVPGISDGIFVAAKYIRRLSAWMDGFTITSDPEIIIEDRGNGIHLKIDQARIAGGNASGGTSDHPFKVNGSAGLYTVTPGGIYTLNHQGEPLQLLARAPFGLPLATYTFATAPSFTGFVVLRTRFSRYTGGADVQAGTFQVEFTAANPTLSDQALIRYNESNSPQDGFVSIVIADISQGNVVAQRVTSSLAITTFWNEVIICRY